MYVDVSTVSFQISNPAFPSWLDTPAGYCLNCRLSSVNVKNSSSSLQIQLPLWIPPSPSPRLKSSGLPWFLPMSWPCFKPVWVGQNPHPREDDSSQPTTWPWWSFDPFSDHILPEILIGQMQLYTVSIFFIKSCILFPSCSRPSASWEQRPHGPRIEPYGLWVFSKHLLICAVIVKQSWVMVCTGCHLWSPDQAKLSPYMTSVDIYRKPRKWGLLLLSSRQGSRGSVRLHQSPEFTWLANRRTRVSNPDWPISKALLWTLS